MEVRAHIKFVSISPIKLRTLIGSIKKVSPAYALDQLGLSQKRTAKVLHMAIKSAVSNGLSNAGFDPKKATFKTLAIDEGRYLKRMRAGSRGMARQYVRKTSHITVVLEQKGIEKGAKPVKVKAAQSKTANVEEVKVAQKVEVVEKPKLTGKPSASSKPRNEAKKSVTNMQRTTNK